MRILIVEDEHKIASSVKRGLEMELYAVDVAYDGIEGYDLAASEDYDAIVLDLMLPGMGGMAICRKLREEKVRTPILMLTAKGSIEDRVAGLNSGADDYLTKPFAFTELLARIRALTRRQLKSKDNVLTVDDLTLNTLTYEVLRDGKAVSLSRKEFALLEYLMRNAGKIINKDQIIAHVWDYEADILPNTVEVYIGYLRKKIDLAFPKRPAVIQTVRGFGYKIGDK